MSTVRVGTSYMSRFRPLVKRNASSNFHRIYFLRIFFMENRFQASFRALDYDPGNARETTA